MEIEIDIFKTDSAKLVLAKVDIASNMSDFQCESWILK